MPNPIKTLILCVLAICSFGQSFAQDWDELSAPSGSTADGLSKTSDGKLFLSTWSGLYRSVNGSAWEKIFGENADIYIDGDDKIYVTMSGKLYISVDAGDTFTERSQLVSSSCRVRKLSNGKLILIAVQNPSSLLFVSEDDGLTWTPQFTFTAGYVSHHQMEVYNDRIFISTLSEVGLLVSDNEGATFVQKNSGATHKGIETIVRTSTGVMFRQSQYAFYRSSNGGETWSPFAQSFNEYLFGELAVNANDELLFFHCGQGKTYVLNQALNQWQVRNANFPFKSQSINATVTIGNDIYLMFSNLGVFKSSGDGLLIEDIGEGIEPVSPFGLSVAGDGGIVIKSNIGISKYANGSWTTTYNTITGDRISGWDIFSFANDRLYLDPSSYSNDHGETWHTSSLPNDYTRTIMGSDQHMYAYNISGPNGPRFFISKDLGETWDEKSITALPRLGLRQKPLAADANYVYLTGESVENYEIWKIDPAAGNAELIYHTEDWIDGILAKGGSLYIEKQGQLHRSDDGGATWAYLPIPSGAIDNGFEFVGNSLWIGSLTGGIQYSSDKGNTWTSMNYPTDDYTTRPISFAADNEGYVYAGVMNVGVIKSHFPILDLTDDNNHKPTSGNVVKQGNEDGVIVFATIDFEAQYADDEDDPLKEIHIASLPGEGTLKLEGQPVIKNQIIPVEDINKLTYTSAADVFGEYKFTFNVSDGKHFSDAEASAILQVASVNDAPAFTVISTVSLQEDFAGPYNITPVMATIPLEDNETIIFSLQPSTSEIVAVDFNSHTGEIKLTSIAHKYGLVEFVLKATDTDDLNSTYSENISVTINDVNYPPTISAITYLHVTGAKETVAFTIDDVDSPVSLLELTASSSNQSLVKDETFDFSGANAERTLSFTVRPFTGETTITISVSDGHLAAQQSFKVMSSLITSILETSVANAISVFPNPVHDLLNVSFTGLTPPFRVSLMDVTGTVVSTSTEFENSFQWQMNSFSAGIYFLRVTDQQKRSIFARVMVK
jgi:photosystem II stability/assembly factor-like uncharacterized protein